MGRPHPVALVVAIGLTIAGGAWAVWQLTHQPEQLLCAGVAFVSAPTAPTEAAALRRFVADRGGDPDEWQRAGPNTWEPTERRGAVPDYSSISVGEVGGVDGGWAASGACV